MAKIYNKYNLAQDICTILSGDFSECIKESALDCVAWAITERKELDADYKFDASQESSLPKAKIQGCKFWSGDAIKYAFELKNGKYKKKSSFDANKLRHEHVIPKSIIKNSILKYKKQPEKIIEIFDKAFACVLTPDEARKIDEEYKTTMPDEKNDILEIKNLWARYIECGVTDIYKVEWKRVSNHWKFVSVAEYKIDN